MSSKKQNMIPQDHPRYESLVLRARMVKAFKQGILADSGLIAHGRGEAFDYLLGERTTEPAVKATEAAAAALLLSEHPVISVNGNTAALAPKEVVSLAEILDSKLEINLFYRTNSRVNKIRQVLMEAGAHQVLGTEKDEMAVIDNLEGPRSRTSRRGVYGADVVLVPLEDGDRAQALASAGKLVITVDLNPLSRTAKTASITIVDNLVRALPNLLHEVEKLKKKDRYELKGILYGFNNDLNLQDSLKIIAENYGGTGKA
jgi:4-phosphopantoate---beta-alanine ligase